MLFTSSVNQPSKSGLSTLKSNYVLEVLAYPWLLTDMLRNCRASHFESSSIQLSLKKHIVSTYAVSRY